MPQKGAYVCLLQNEEIEPSRAKPWIWVLTYFRITNKTSYGGMLVSQKQTDRPPDTRIVIL